MKARVTARWWDEELRAHFGECGSIHHFPDDLQTFMVRYAIPFGRFQVHQEEPDGTLTIEFQNDYD